jgi:alkylation response protein AidB-like acyl-CoA dehydrogenase
VHGASTDRLHRGPISFTLALGRTGVGVVGMGLAQCAFEHAAAYMSRRSALGKKLGEVQH